MGLYLHHKTADTYQRGLIPGLTDKGYKFLIGTSAMFWPVLFLILGIVRLIKLMMKIAGVDPHSLFDVSSVASTMSKGIASGKLQIPTAWDSNLPELEIDAAGFKAFRDEAIQKKTAARKCDKFTLVLTHPSEPIIGNGKWYLSTTGQGTLSEEEKSAFRMIASELGGINADFFYDDLGPVPYDVPVLSQWVMSCTWKEPS